MRNNKIDVDDEIINDNTPSRRRAAELGPAILRPPATGGIYAISS